MRTALACILVIALASAATGMWTVFWGMVLIGGALVVPGLKDTFFRKID